MKNLSIAFSALSLTMSLISSASAKDSPLDVCDISIDKTSYMIVIESTAETPKDFNIGFGTVADSDSVRLRARIIKSKDEMGELGMEREIDCSVKDKVLHCSGDDQIKSLEIDYSEYQNESVLLGIMRSKYFKGSAELSYPKFILKAGKVSADIFCSANLGFTWGT